MVIEFIVHVLKFKLRQFFHGRNLYIVFEWELTGQDYGLHHPHSRSDRASWVIGASTDCDVHFYGLVVTGLVRLEIIIYIYALPSSK